MCLFTIVLVYQILPRKPKRNPRSKPLTLTGRRRPHGPLRTTFDRLFPFHKASRPPPSLNPPDGSSSASLRRKFVRPFHLPSERENRRKNIRDKFSTSLRLKVDIPRTSKFNLPPLSSYIPTSRKLYTHLDDKDEFINQPACPRSAVLSPWSLSESDYPDTAPLIPQEQLDSLLPPPRVYVPETPTRPGGRGYRGEPIIHRPSSVETLASFIDPFVDEPKEPLDELRDVVVRIARDHRTDLDRSVFVIGDEWDSSSDVSDDASFEGIKLS